MQPWIWAVGIEDTFIVQTWRGERALDEYVLTQHDRFWREDLERARGLGVQMIRYGIPWYRVEPSPGTFDWTWVDEVMNYFAVHRELIPIIDLVHYGTPLWMKNEFMNGTYPKAVARYVAEFVERYQSVTEYYTPLNEPFINAEWCGWSGRWPPYLTGHLGFCLMMNQLCQGIIHTVQAIRGIQPSAKIVQVEASKKYVPIDDPTSEDAQFWNTLRYLSWDLILGRIDSAHPLYGWLVNSGFSEERLAWFRENSIDVDIVGLNYYPQYSVNIICQGDVGREVIPGTLHGSQEDFIDIVTDAYYRFNKPVMITETSYWGTVEERVRWLDELVQACHTLTASGVDLYGVTWFPFIDMVDWSYRTNHRTVEDSLATFGLFSLKPAKDGTFYRERNAAADRFESIVKGKW